MDLFFNASSVAVIGVSSSPTNLGRAIVFNLMQFQYQGLIHLVGPKGGVFLGHKIYPTILDVPDPVDLAAVLVPARAVPEVIRQCGEKGVKRVVVESAGFRELGDDRRGLEREIQEALAKYNMRMIGPNCIGVINRHTGLAVPFMPMKPEADPGRVGIISQSGGVGAMAINNYAAENIGFSKFASIGNKLDVDENDILEYLVGDDQTRVIFAYLEGIADGRRLMQVAASSPKPILVHKSNRGGSGSVIARSHSASLSADDRVVDAAFRQSGILRVSDQNEALRAIKGFHLPPMKGPRLAVISRSGGHAVMAADAADEFGFQLPPFPEELIEEAERHARAGVIQFHNPMDLGDVFDLDLYKVLAAESIRRDDVDGVLFILNYQGIFDADPCRRLIVELGRIMKVAGKPIAVCVFTMHGELEVNKRAAGYPLFTDPRDALQALAWNRDFRGGPVEVFGTEPPGGIRREEARRLLEGAESGPAAPDLLAQLLDCYGIPVVAWEVAESEEEAVLAASKLGLPVALKTANPHVIHKTDAGGVFLDLTTEEEVRKAYGRLEELGPRVLVQRMAEPGLEWLVGGRRDHTFGPVVIAGLGGIYVEVFRETALRVGPLSPRQARAMLEECRGTALLRGVRGRPKLDEDALVDGVVRLSWLLHDLTEVMELDLNPVRVYEKGWVALDWRATLDNRK
ncbi:acetyltransferase [Desulfacinum infernum DSM 9756]|jgi:acetyltransferase|uniref:Acetyltransferase n=1 Tax=Desulfacinum infernum DSM 9756 TaxID=1121391 RepID=A0A1M4UMX0_9BACT|nr:acetate--CoA ligase [Desulfacinum infernum]MBC7358873.1 acetate--CoA ligase family protein [Desulfacinum sp.]SHE57920.1 acetyltransferase [Desulfacinum infernum DSM 9756]